MIPKIIHQIWLGKKPINEELLGFASKWMKHNPGWSYVLWTEDLIHSAIEPINKSLFGREVRWIEKCDLIRYEILYKFGGVYVDIDVESVKGLDPLLEGVDQFISRWLDEGESWNGTCYPLGGLNGATMGCSKNNPYFKELLEKLPKAKEDFPHCGNNSAGPMFLDRETLTIPEITKIKKAYLSPYAWFEPARPASEYPEAYAIHRWVGFYSGGKYNDPSITDCLNFE